jgi:hypothetical protein
MGQTTGTYPASKRIVVVPLVDPPTKGGRSQALVRGFAAFFIDSYGGGNVTGRFISGTIDGLNAQWGMDNFWGTSNTISKIKLVT